MFVSREFVRIKLHKTTIKLRNPLDERHKNIAQKSTFLLFLGLFCRYLSFIDQVYLDGVLLQPTFSSPTDEIQKKSPKNRNLILKKKVNLINGRLVRGLFTLTNCYKVSNSQESMINENYHPNQINLPSVAQ